MHNPLDFAALEASSMRKRHALDLMILVNKMSCLTARTKTVVHKSNTVVHKSNQLSQKIYRTERETLDQKIAFKSVAWGAGNG